MVFKCAHLHVLADVSISVRIEKGGEEGRDPLTFGRTGRKQNAKASHLSNGDASDPAAVNQIEEGIAQHFRRLARDGQLEV